MFWTILIDGRIQRLPQKGASACDDESLPRFQPDASVTITTEETEAPHEMLEFKGLQSGSAQPRLCVQQISQH